MVKLLLALSLLLTGCASAVKPLPPEIRYVKVEPPAPPVVNRPELPVLSLKPGDTPDVVIQAHRESIKLLQQWGLQLEAILDGYRKKDK